MNIKPIYVSVEFNDGRTFNDVRVIFADRLALQKTAKARGWKDLESIPITAAGFQAWAALTRRGLYTADYETFLTNVVDVSMSDEREAAEEDDAADPQSLPKAPSPEPSSPSL